MTRDTENQAVARWQGVPLEFENAWQKVFQATQELLDLSTPCPICGVCSLHDGITFIVGVKGCWRVNALLVTAGYGSGAVLAAAMNIILLPCRNGGSVV